MRNKFYADMWFTHSVIYAVFVVESNSFFVLMIVLSAVTGVAIIVAVILLIVMIKQRANNKRSYRFVTYLL